MTKLERLRDAVVKAKTKKEEAETALVKAEKRLKEAENQQILADVGSFNLTPEELAEILLISKGRGKTTVDMEKLNEKAYSIAEEKEDIFEDEE